MSENESSSDLLNHPSATADFAVFDFYTKLDKWTLDEAIALIHGKNPRVVSRKRIEQCKDTVTPCLEKYIYFLGLVQRTEYDKRLSNPVNPSEFLAWAKQKEIYIPPELSALVERRCPTNVDWRDRYEKLKKDADTLQDLFDKQGEQFDRLAEASALLNKHGNSIANTAKILTEERDALKARVAELEANQPTGGQEPDKPVSVKEKTTYLNIIGGLLELLLKEKMPGGLNKWTQDTITSALLDSHSDKQGISPSSLGHKFAAANRSLKSS